MKRLEIGDEVYVRYKCSKLITRMNFSYHILNISKLEGNPMRIIVPFDGIRDLVGLDFYIEPKKEYVTSFASTIGYDELCPVFSYAFQFENHVW